MARRRVTAWARVLIGTVTALVALSLLSQLRVLGPGGPGKQLLEMLSWFALALCVVEAVRQTADCISSETREGTLGLLRLTPLSAFDLVLGKLAAGSLTTFFGLLATFPILAISLPAGGVTAGEFWRIQLVLINTLFLALACGVCISAHHREEVRSVLATVTILGGIWVLPLLLSIIPGGEWIASFSPVLSMRSADDTHYRIDPGEFWLTMLLIQLIAWGFLVRAGTVVNKVSSDDAMPVSSGAHHRKEEGAWNYRVPPSLRSRSKLPVIDTNPAAWLAQRMQGDRSLIWIAILMIVLLDHITFAVFQGLIRSRLSNQSGFWFSLQMVGSVVPAFLLALVSSRTLSEPRRSGALELLVCTPMSQRQIVHGYWQGLWRRLRLPVLVAIGVTILKVVFLFRWQGFHASSPGIVVLQLLTFVIPIVEIFAICWLGLWWAIRARRPSHSVGIVLVLVVLIPWFGSSLVRLLGGFFFRASGGGVTREWIWAMLVLPAVSVTAYFLVLILWSRFRLLTRFRETLARV